MQREIRQRCGFGCVVCGIPIYDYEHVIEYSEVDEHQADNITLLCPTHHREKTNKLLPLEQLREADANPWNLGTGESTAHHLHFNAASAEVNLGGNRQVSATSFSALMVDGQSLVGFNFEDNRCMLNLNLFNDANEPVLQVVNNELKYSVGNWDVDFVGSTLTIREGLGQIFLEVDFLPPGHVLVPRGRLQYNGIEMEIRPDSLLVMNNSTLISGSQAYGDATLLDLGDNPDARPTAIKIQFSPMQRNDFDRDAARCFRREHMR
jgi:hypothetical protein